MVNRESASVVVLVDNDKELDIVVGREPASLVVLVDL